MYHIPAILSQANTKFQLNGFLCPTYFKFLGDTYLELQDDVYKYTTHLNSLEGCVAHTVNLLLLL